MFGNLISTNGQEAKCSTITTCGDDGKIPNDGRTNILPADDRTDVYCAGATCTTADEATCCQQEWSPGIPNDSFFTDMLGTYKSDFCIGQNSAAPGMNDAMGAEWCRQVTDKNKYKEIDYSDEGLDTWNKIVQNCAKECVSYDATTTAKEVFGSACVAFAIQESDTVHMCILFPHYKNNPIDGTNHYAYPFYSEHNGNQYRSKCYMKYTFDPPDSDDTSDYATYCNYIPPAKCSTYDTDDCGNGLGLIGNAANVDCGSSLCTTGDENTCCKGDATCLEDQHVVFDSGSLENVCTNCAPGKYKSLPGDVPSQGTTACICTLCAADGSEKVVGNECVACGGEEKSAPLGEACGADTECYGKDDLTAFDVARLKNLVGGSAIDVGTEQTCLKARYNAIAGCSRI
jgi:hypothetical protein